MSDNIESTTATATETNELENLLREKLGPVRDLKEITSVPTVKLSSGSAKSQFDAAVSILAVIGEAETSAYWIANRNQVLSTFGSVRTKSADGEATKAGVDFGSASLAKVLKHLSTPKREGALLAAAWAMASAMSLK